MQPEMGAVVMIVRDVLGQKPPEVALVQSDDVVEQLTSATANPAFRNSVLPGALDGGLDSSNFHGTNRNRNFQSVFCVAIEEEKLRRRLVGKRFPQLLHNPGAGRMACDIEVQDAPAAMADDKETVEKTEGDRRNGEEVHGRDGFTMIAEKSQPPPTRLWISGCSLHPAGNASLRYIEAEHQKFAMNARSTPGGILGKHAENQVPDLFREPFSTHLLSHPGDDAPVQTEAGSMPTNHGFRSNHDERLFPPGPESAGDHPEDFVESAELWFGMLTFQYGELLPERQIFHEQAPT